MDWWSYTTGLKKMLVKIVIVLYLQNVKIKMEVETCAHDQMKRLRHEMKKQSESINNNEYRRKRGIKFNSSEQNK